MGAFAAQLSRPWKVTAIAVVLALFVFAFDRCQMMYWVGGTDLEVQFIVTASGSQDPVPAARIEVESHGGFYDGSEQCTFALIADEQGIAEKVCRNSMCYGGSSGLG